MTGEAGGGLVKVTITCDYEVQGVEIGQEAFEERELLEDLVRAAIGEALRQAKAESVQNLKAATGGLPIPPGLF